MNIQKIFITHSWSDVGVNIQTKTVAKKLSESIRVFYLSQARIGKSSAKINDNLIVHEWPNKRPNSIKDFLFICKKIWKEKPGAFVANFGATNISMIAAWLLRVKYRICWLHTMSEQFYIDVKDEHAAKKIIKQKKRIYALATHVVVLNEYGKVDAIKNYSIPEGKISKIYNGINPVNITPGEKKNYKSIRYSGRLDRSKGVDILIRAFAKVYQQDKTVKLEIAGRGDEENKLKELVKSEQLNECVIFHGYFDHYTKALQFIADAYCLVVPSRIDNFPTVILEAFAAGVPVIASNVGGIPDMVQNETEGLLVEKEKVEGLSIAIQKMIDDCVMRNRMGSHAYKTFEEKFSMEKHVENVVEFLESLK